MSFTFRLTSSANVVVRVPYAPFYSSSLLPQHKEYHLHPSHLSAPYLRDLLRTAKRNPVTSARVLTLDSTTVDHFDIYEDWLQTGDIAILSELRQRSQQSIAMSLGQSLGLLRTKATKSSTPDEARANYENLLGCYALGAMLRDHHFRDAVSSKIIHLLRTPNSHQSQFIRITTCELVQAVIKQYTISSPLYALLVSAYARFSSVHEISVLAFSSHPGHFKSSVMQALATLRSKQHIDGNAAADFAVGECRFHGHGFYEPCSVRKRWC